MKPKLRPPGTKRLKLRFDEPLSSFGFRFNLRRHMKGIVARMLPEYAAQIPVFAGDVVGRCRLTLSNSS
jgi:hypothetical protein